MLAIVAAFALAACDTVPDFPNLRLTEGASNKEPVIPLDPDPDAPLIVMTFSGGGSRAAALGLGVLDELTASTYPSGSGPMRLIDRVKMVSSVSGGSVVAAWFGYAGADRLDEIKDRFLVRDNMATLEWQAADPLTWFRLAFSGYTRIDALRDMFDSELFDKKTFADLGRNGTPVVVMNATDIESGEVFSFTSQRFDDLCSRLDGLPISVGVAASAAFPVALSPMSLRNFSYEKCNGVISPGTWIHTELTTPLPRYLDLEEYKRARYANALRNGPDGYRNENYLHLLDGGLADNQGVQALTEVLISPHAPAQWKSPHGAMRLLEAINLGIVKRIIVISVNARSDADNGVGSHASVPGLPKVVNAVIGTPIDATTAHANAALQTLVDELNTAGGAAPAAGALFSGLRVYGIVVDFDQFLPGQKMLQMIVKSIGTSWTLTPDQLQKTIEAGRLLLRQHPCFQRLLVDLKSPQAAVTDAEARRNCTIRADGSY